MSIAVPKENRFSLKVLLILYNNLIKSSSNWLAHLTIVNVYNLEKDIVFPLDNDSDGVWLAIATRLELYILGTSNHILLVHSKYLDAGPFQGTINRFTPSTKKSLDHLPLLICLLT